MSSPGSLSRCQALVIAGVAVCLLALLLLHAPAPGLVLAVVVLFPVLLFGLVPVPRSLWPLCGLEQRFALPIRCRRSLFQRPPPKH